MLIVGLGNPGERYEWTRHNLGFMLVDLLARQTNALVKRAECRALVGRAELEGRAVELVKPQTYMNLSGESVACLLRKRAGLKPAGGLVGVSRDIAPPLGLVTPAQRGEVEKVLERCAEALRAVVRDGIDKAMSQYNVTGDK